jgi:hypothetical protein
MNTLKVVVWDPSDQLSTERALLGKFASVIHASTEAEVKEVVEQGMVFLVILPATAFFHVTGAEPEARQIHRICIGATPRIHILAWHKHVVPDGDPNRLYRLIFAGIPPLDIQAPFGEEGLIVALTETCKRGRFGERTEIGELMTALRQQLDEEAA